MGILKFEKLSGSWGNLYCTMLPAMLRISKHVWLEIYFL